MADSPKSNTMQYIWAGLVMVLLGALFIVAILWLRPELDPVILITAVMGAFGVLFTSLASFMKAQETHATVNSQLTAWKSEFGRLAHAEGQIEGALTEQERRAEADRLRVQSETASGERRERPAVPPAVVVVPAPAVAPTAAPLAAPAAAPVEVFVKNVDPVPVELATPVPVEVKDVKP